MGKKPTKAELEQALERYRAVAAQAGALDQGVEVPDHEFLRDRLAHLTIENGEFRQRADDCGAFDDSVGVGPARFLTDHLNGLSAKVECLARFVEAEDGVFAFPDGDSIQVRNPGELGGAPSTRVPPKVRGAIERALEILCRRKLNAASRIMRAEGFLREVLG